MEGKSTISSAKRGSMVEQAIGSNVQLPEYAVSEDVNVNDAANIKAALGTANDMVSSTANTFISPAKELVRSEKKDANTAATMLTASAKSIARIHSSFFKGTMVDMPLALTEGLRAVPRLYGEEVRDTGTVTDWSSGAIVASKSFAYGLYDGFTGFVKQPYDGAKEEGWAGLGKGIGKETSGLLTKPSSGALGLVAYSGQGICKSLHKLTHRRCEKVIATALHAEGNYLADNTALSESTDAAVLAAFDATYNADQGALSSTNYGGSSLSIPEAP
ncbi:MAG: hypothetical protein M1812_000222 [Candelaria pacifica]|nr:MAG: hypothetical protein M1812_000222 [Candelaria pacifica]